MYRTRLQGFTLTEVLIVLIIIGILVMLAIPRFQPLITRARSTEARISLGHLHTLEQGYFMLNSAYSKSLGDIGFEQEPTVIEGGNAHYEISISYADEEGFRAEAVSVVDFDGDGKYNTWEVDESRKITESIPD